MKICFNLNQKALPHLAMSKNKCNHASFKASLTFNQEHSHI